MTDLSIKYFRYINYLLIAAILVSTFLLAGNIVMHSFVKKDKSAANKEPSPPRGLKNNLMYYSPILEKNPFGSSMKLQPIAVSNLPEEAGPGTISELVLFGTVVGPEHLSYAIFEDRSQSPSRQEVFAFGEMVFNFGKLVKVGRSSVEIEQDSTKYTLTIPFEDLSSASTVYKAGQTKNSKPSFIKKLSEKDYEVDRKSILQSLEQPEHILTDARLLPNIKDGRQEGFVILEVLPGGLYDNLGLKNNDILLRVNGLAISNPEVAIQAMTALKGMNRINLDISRSSRKMSLSYRLR